MSLSIVYRDFSSFLYRWNNVVVAVDPTISRFSNGAWIRRWVPDPCDYIFITHAHFDHFADAPAIMEATMARMVAAPALCWHVERVASLAVERFVEVFAGDEAELDGFSVEVAEADHGGFEAIWPELLRVPGTFLRMVVTQLSGPLDREMLSFIFRFGDEVIFHCGEGLNDRTDLELLRRIAVSHPAHILVCAADLDFSVEVAEAVAVLNPREVILYSPHDAIYADMRVPVEPIEAFTLEIKRRCPATPIVVMTPDDRYDLFSAAKAKAPGAASMASGQRNAS